jgi:uncharacterized protein (DUF2062 family)
LIYTKQALTNTSLKRLLATRFSIAQGLLAGSFNSFLKSWQILFFSKLHEQIWKF